MSLWMDLYRIISQDVRFSNMLGQPGKTPVSINAVNTDFIPVSFHINFMYFSIEIYVKSIFEWNLREFTLAWNLRQFIFLWKFCEKIYLKFNWKQISWKSSEIHMKMFTWILLYCQFHVKIFTLFVQINKSR